MGSYLLTITMTGHYLYLLFFLSLSSTTPFPAHQQNLLSTLFGPDYNPLFIPVKNASVPQEVFMEATLQKINDVTGHIADDLKRDNPFLVIDSDGHVRWIPPLVLKTMCDFTADDKETQTCELKFGSWVYNANQLDLISKISSMDLEGYTANQEWDLESASVERHETSYDCCPDAFVDMTYAICFHIKSVWSLI